MLKSIDTNLWTVDRPFGRLVGSIGTRMTVIKLADGGLFLHSPVKLDPELRAALDQLGPVRFVAAPNRAHHLFVGDYIGAFPEATIFAAPGLPEKRKDLNFHGVLGDEPPAGWAGQIDQHLFGGALFLNEVDFFHRATRTLLLTDVAFGERINDEFWTRAFYLMTNCPSFGPHRMIRLIIRDHEAAKKSVQRIMQWDFDRVIMTHGKIVESGARERFAQAFSYL